MNNGNGSNSTRGNGNNGSTPPQHPQPPLTQIKKHVLQAVNLAKRGHLQRACKVLQRPPSHPTTEDVVSQLRALHPQRTNEAPPLPGLPDGPPSPTPVTPALVKKIIKRIANGAAPGPSGWTGETLLCLSRDEECLAGICSLVGDIINDRLSFVSRSALLQSLLLGIPKDDDSVRPIAIGEVFYKIACLHQLHMIRSVLGRYFEPLQYAICTNGGTERAFREILAALEASGEHVVALLVDLSNAFNTEDCASMLNELYQRPQLRPLWGLANFGYGRGPSSLAIRKADGSITAIPSQQGSRQGDVLGLLLFCLSIHPTFIRAQENLPSVTAKAIADDFTAVGHVDEVITVLERFSTRHNLNRTKTKILWPHNSPIPESLNNAARLHGVTVVTVGTKLLGGFLTLPENQGPIGPAADHLQSVVDKHRPMFTLLKNPLIPKQVCLSLLRVCIQPRMIFHARISEPDTAAEAMAEFDSLISDVFLYIILLEDETSSLLLEAIDHYRTTPMHLCAQQIVLPLRMGGIGLRTLAQISPTAFWASSVAASVEVDAIFEDTRRSTIPLLQSHTHAVRVNTLTRLTQSGAPTSAHPNINAEIHATGRGRVANFACLPASAELLTPFYNRADLLHQSIQKLLTAQIERLKFDSLRLGLDFRGQIRLESMTSKGASAWLMPPSDDSPETIMPDRRFVAALRLRLGLPYSFILKDTCYCGVSLTGEDADPYHFLSCVPLSSSSINQRHDDVKLLLDSIFNRYGIPSQVEQRPPFYVDRRKPDIKTINPSTFQTLYLDVAVCSSTAPTVINTSQSLRNLLEQGATRKRNKYRYLSENDPAIRFLPVVLESFGAMHSDVRRILNMVRSSAVLNGSIQESEGSFFISKLLQSVSTCLS